MVSECLPVSEVNLCLLRLAVNNDTYSCCRAKPWPGPHFRGVLLYSLPAVSILHVASGSCSYAHLEVHASPCSKKKKKFFFFFYRLLRVALCSSGGPLTLQFVGWAKSTACVAAAKRTGNNCRADQQLPKPVPLDCPQRETEARFLFYLSIEEVRMHSKRTRHYHQNTRETTPVTCYRGIVVISRPEFRGLICNKYSTPSALTACIFFVRVCTHTCTTVCAEMKQSFALCVYGTKFSSSSSNCSTARQSFNHV